MRALLVFAYVTFACIVVATVCLVDTPVLGDYLNHLARMHVLSAIGASADLRRYYEVDWKPIPYLAMDVIVPLLMHVFPLYLSGKIFVVACVLMPAAAAASLHYAIYRRAGWVPLAAFLFSQNMLLSLGFLNFLFSAGCAVMLFAGWIATACWRRWLRVVSFAPLILLLYLGHAFACLAYCLSVAGYEVGRALRARFRPRNVVAADFATALLPAIPAIACAATLNVGAGYVGRLHTVFGDAGTKLFALASPVLFATDRTQILVLVAGIAVLAAALPRLHLAQQIWPAALLVGLCATAVPHILDSTWGTDLRLPLICVLLLAGAARLQPGSARVSAGLVLALACLVGAKSADAWTLLHRRDARLRETRGVLQSLPAGARLLVVSAAQSLPDSAGSPSDLWQLPLIAVIEHDAFVPYFFSGLSSVHIRAPYRSAATPNGRPITPDQLRTGQDRRDEPGADVPDGPGGGRLYHFNWPHKFDYVLVQSYGNDAGPLPSCLHLVAGTRDVSLYRIDPARCAPGAR